MKWLSTLLLLNIAEGFVNCRMATSPQRLLLHSVGNENIDNELLIIDDDFVDPNDPYSDIFDMQIPLTEVDNTDLVSSWSIAMDERNPSISNGDTSIESTKQFRPRKDKSTDMSGLLAIDDKDGDEWLKEARDVIEMKKGYAIWSKRSDVEIQREIKKAALSKALNIPEPVARIVRLVHLDRSNKLSELRKDRRYEMACIDYRKWLNDQRKRMKKDPIPVAKVEVSKRWISEHPAVTGSAASVVMDDRTEPLYGVVMDTGGKTPSGVMTTSSMVNWEKSAVELSVITKPVTPLGRTDATAKGEDKAQSQFRIDDMDMFVVTDEDFFVVI
eukprot:gene4915-9805_t